MSAIIIFDFDFFTKEASTVDIASSNALSPTTSPYLGRWQLRYSSGVHNRRVIFVMILSGDLVADLSFNIKAVEQFYRDCDLPSWFMIFPASVLRE